MLTRFAVLATVTAAMVSATSAAHIHVKVHKATHGSPSTAITPGPAADTPAPTQHSSGGAPTSTPAAAGTPSKSPATSTGAPSGSGKKDKDSTPDDGKWHMQPVVAIHARAKGDMPVWDDTTNSWVSKYGKTPDEQYSAAMDSVNTASPEGALYFLQAECINVKDQSEKCKRKNGVQYIVFYETTISQPEYSMAFNADYKPPEYCPFLAIDSAQCTPEKGNELPDACKQIYGLDGQPKLGPCVGTSNKEIAGRGPYPGNYWFSFPGGCLDKLRNDKTDECRKEHASGLCPRGVTPDGQKCTFSYRILGFVSIDDIVGITAMKNKQTGKNYGNYTEFCEAGEIEFEATLSTSTDTFTDVKSIDFWQNPGNESANKARFESMIKTYNEQASKAKTGKMLPLPEISELSAKNPPCYKNTAQCATAANGCRRVLYSQLCEVCEKADKGCEKAPSGYEFPKLEKPKTEKNSSSNSTDKQSTGSKSGGTSNDAQNKSSDATTVGVSVASTIIAALLLSLW
ncbi:TPA: hypothetical protein N0F65_006054 [Lagenidium giganteum]|uniref:Secreted protein n=1 Tax=Lagenidium giganteum TaxID=4803 RepID=A0AAV2YLP6_9STRA|nr:TPA: hypothetical protein N0F65_006054 [Lagenidium giganteum]